jgi:hypothetical protein
MKKSIVHIQLVKMLVLGSSDNRQYYHSSEFGTWRKRVIVIQAFTSGVSLCNKSGFVSFNKDIYFEVQFIDPLATNRLFVRRKINNYPSIIKLK